MSHESEKVRLLRERLQNDNPDRAAAAAAARFERDAIRVPDALAAPEDAPLWKRRLHDDAASLYRELVIAEPGGLTLTELRASVHFGAKRTEEAMRFLRRSGTTTESRRGVDGFDVDRITLRVKS